LFLLLRNYSTLLIRCFHLTKKTAIFYPLMWCKKFFSAPLALLCFPFWSACMKTFYLTFPATIFTSALLRLKLFTTVFAFPHVVTTFCISSQYSGRLTLTIAAGTGGVTALPHLATCFVFGYGFPSGSCSIM